ncbi:MAG: hypothetical protein AAF913_12450, partial [Pseudomonadota bacterium]
MARARTMAVLGVVSVLAACAEEPAGGRGPFDPPPVNSPIFNNPSATEFRPFPELPEPSPPESEADALAADVTAALRTTQTPGTTGSTVPSSGPVVSVAPTITGPVVAGTGPDATTGAAPVDPFSQDIGIDPNDTAIDLNAQSQEQQKRQREIAARQREAAREQLEVFEPEPIAPVDPNANVIAFARATSHPLGTKVYNRPPFRDRSQTRSTCRRFANADDAQRQFLANGGPNTDRFNL